MELTEIYELVISYISIWLPAVISALTVICGVVSSLVNIRRAVNELRNTKDFTDLQAKIAAQDAHIQELNETLKITINESKKIKDYTETKSKRKGDNR